MQSIFTETARMQNLFTLITTLFLSIGLSAQGLYFPPTSGSSWDTLSPSALNWCPERIDSLYTFLDAEETHSFIVLKDGEIVLEKYFAPYTADSLWIWYSAGKSLMASLVGIAQDEGHLNIWDKTSDHLGTGWTSLAPAREDSILIWNQLTMTTGLDEAEFFCTDSNCLVYKAPASARWVYHNAPYSLTRDVLESATGESLNAYTNSRIENKIGMSGFWFPVGYNNFYFSRARDMARFGLMIQASGMWNETAVIADTAYFQQMTSRSQELNKSYGYLWWLNGEESHIAPESPAVINEPIAPHAPADVFTAAGSQGQFISISPSLGIVMIRQGESSSPDLAAIDLHDQIWSYLMDLECPTGIESATSSNISVYPNPTSAMLTIDGLNDGVARITVINSLGETVLENNLQDNTLNVQDLAKGHYTLRIDQNSHTTFKTFIHL